jgi:hypothetical protein
MKPRRKGGGRDGRAAERKESDWPDPPSLGLRETERFLTPQPIAPVNGSCSLSIYTGNVPPWQRVTIRSKVCSWILAEKFMLPGFNCLSIGRIRVDPAPGRTLRRIE